MIRTPRPKPTQANANLETPRTTAELAARSSRALAVSEHLKAASQEHLKTGHTFATSSM
jgi:hypothetical protein